MRLLSSALLSLALLSIVAQDAQAEDGRIQRVRLKELDSARIKVVVTTRSENPGPASDVRMFIEPQALDGAAPLVPELAAGGLVREDLRNTFEIPADLGEAALFGAVIGLNTGKKEKDVPLEALLEGTEPSAFGASIDLGDMGSVRARLQREEDGTQTLEVSLVATGGETLDPTTVQLIGPGLPFPLTSKGKTTMRSFAAMLYGNPDDPPMGAYQTEVRWENAAGETIDGTSMVLDLGDGMRGSRVEQVTLGETQRGDTRLVTRVSAPDARPLVVESVVTEADGSTVIAVADERPQWTERQFIASGLVFEGDLVDASYVVFATPRSEEGEPLSRPFALRVNAERPTDEAPELQTTLFWEDTAQIALFPESESTWRLFVRSVGDLPVDSWTFQFAEGNAAFPDELQVAELTRVWHQYRQVARGIPLSDEARDVETVIADPEADTTIAARGVETEGAVNRTGNSVEDIEAFVQSLTGGSTTIIRTAPMRRARR